MAGVPGRMRTDPRRRECGDGGREHGDGRRGPRRTDRAGQDRRRGRGRRPDASLRVRRPDDGAGPAAAGPAQPVRLDGLRPVGLAERLHGARPRRAVRQHRELPRLPGGGRAEQGVRGAPPPHPDEEVRHRPRGAAVRPPGQPRGAARGGRARPDAEPGGPGRGPARAAHRGAQPPGGGGDRAPPPGPDVRGDRRADRPPREDGPPRDRGGPQAGWRSGNGHDIPPRPRPGVSTVRVRPRPIPRPPTPRPSTRPTRRWRRSWPSSRPGGTRAIGPAPSTSPASWTPAVATPWSS